MVITSLESQVDKTFTGMHIHKYIKSLARTHAGTHIHTNSHSHTASYNYRAKQTLSIWLTECVDTHIDMRNCKPRHPNTHTHTIQLRKVGKKLRYHITLTDTHKHDNPQAELKMRLERRH